MHTVRNIATTEFISTRFYLIKKLTMPELNCMFWNVRNLSRSISRSGRRSGKLDILQKFRPMIDYFKQQSLDLIVLLETGSDAAEFAVVLNNHLRTSRITYTAIASQTTKDETYIILYNSTKVASINNLSFHGPKKIDTIKCRQALAFEVAFEQHVVQLCTIHAPSTSMSLGNRKKLFSQLSASLATNANLILFGDFNFKATEQVELRQAIHTDFHPIGPIENANFLPTSLRTFESIITKSDFFSQPYDQVWAKLGLGNGQITSCTRASIEQIKLPQVTETHILKFILNQLFNSAVHLNFEERTRYPRKPTNSFHFTAHEDYLEALEIVKNIPHDFSTILSSAKEILSENDVKSVASYLNLVTTELKRSKVFKNKTLLEYNPLFFKYKGNKSIVSVRIKLLKNHAKKIQYLSLYIEGIRKAYQGRKSQTTEGKINLQHAFFEYAISDHLPVKFTYTV